MRPDEPRLGAHVRLTVLTVFSGTQVSIVLGTSVPSFSVTGGSFAAPYISHLPVLVSFLLSLEGTCSAPHHFPHPSPILLSSRSCLNTLLPTPTASLCHVVDRCSEPPLTNSHMLTTKRICSDPQDVSEDLNPLRDKCSAKPLRHNPTGPYSPISTHSNHHHYSINANVAQGRAGISGEEGLSA